MVWQPVLVLRYAFLLMMLFTAAAAFAGYDAADQAELAKLRGYVNEVGARVAQLQQQLVESERRNQLQSQLIEALEGRLSEQQRNSREFLQAQRLAFFADLRDRLPLSPVYRVESDRVVVSADPVFVFGKGEIGAEGQARLHPLALALQQSVQTLPHDRAWRLRIEGHTDSRPIRSNRRFSDNWELSAARSVSMLQFLHSRGIAAEHLSAAGFAATRPLADGDSKADHRRNRRIEVHLELEGTSHNP